MFIRASVMSGMSDSSPGGRERAFPPCGCEASHLGRADSFPALGLGITGARN